MRIIKYILAAFLFIAFLVFLGTAILLPRFVQEEAAHYRAVTDSSDVEVEVMHVRRWHEAVVVNDSLAFPMSYRTDEERSLLNQIQPFDTLIKPAGTDSLFLKRGREVEVFLP